MIDPSTRKPVFSALERPQPAYDTKTGVGNKFTGDKPYEPGRAMTPR